MAQCAARLAAGLLGLDIYRWTASSWGEANGTQCTPFGKFELVGKSVNSQITGIGSGSRRRAQVASRCHHLNMVVALSVADREVRRHRCALPDRTCFPFQSTTAIYMDSSTRDAFRGDGPGSGPERGGNRQTSLPSRGAEWSPVGGGQA